jgi:hypothetical protein
MGVFAAGLSTGRWTATGGRASRRPGVDAVVVDDLLDAGHAMTASSPVRSMMVAPAR